MIKTERLDLVKIKIEDVNELHKIWSDKEAMKYTYATFRSNIADSKKWIEEINSKNFEEIGPFAVFSKERVVGYIGAQIYNRSKKEYGLFYQFNREEWGKGYGYEAARGLIDYLFEVEKAETINADVVEINIPSIKILNKLGMIQFEEVEKGFKRDGISANLCKYTLERSRWEITKETDE